MTVCILNHDYADYVVRAVESALAQTHPDTEVVVVDDGSTDDSVARLTAFGGEIRLVTQANAGMAAAMNRAFSESSGDHVLFLDADDLLDASCVERALRGAGAGVAKVHWRLQLVDAEERSFGHNPPVQVQLASGDVREVLCRTGGYVTVPTSGNLWARWALDAVLPVPEDDFRDSGDGYLNLAVPFTGEVAAVTGALTSYRVHDRNHSTQRERLDLGRLRIRLDQARVLDEWLPRVCARHGLTSRRGTVLGQPDFRFMQLLDEHAAPVRRPAGVRVADGLRLSRAVVGTSLRQRRKVLLGAAGPLLPLLPRRWGDHVRDVAFGGKPVRLLPRRR